MGLFRSTERRWQYRPLRDGGDGLCPHARVAKHTDAATKRYDDADHYFALYHADPEQHPGGFNKHTSACPQQRPVTFNKLTNVAPTEKYSGSTHGHHDTTNQHARPADQHRGAAPKRSDQRAALRCAARGDGDTAFSDRDQANGCDGGKTNSVDRWGRQVAYPGFSPA